MNDGVFDGDRPQLPADDGDAGDYGTLDFEVPMRLEMLPDGQDGIVCGDYERYRELNHLQGDNPYGFKGTCGLVSCEDVLRQFGMETSEAEMVHYAIEHRLCSTEGSDPGEMGGTTIRDQARILSDNGVPATENMARSLDELAASVEAGRGVILEVNAGVLWNDADYYGFGEPNHAVVVTGTARDPETGAVLGAFINDSGRGLAGDDGRFIDAATLNAGWLQAGGLCVVTDVVKI